MKDLDEIVNKYIEVVYITPTYIRQYIPEQNILPLKLELQELLERKRRKK